MPRGGKRPNSGPRKRTPQQVADQLQQKAERLRAENDKAEGVSAAEAVSRFVRKAVGEPKPNTATEKAKGGVDVPIELLERLMMAGSNRQLRHEGSAHNPFRVPWETFPKACIPDKKMRIAMDENVAWASAQWANGGGLGIQFGEGLAFPGYPLLAELAQRPEYRTASETIAGEMTRKWIKLRGRGDMVGGEEDKESSKKRTTDKAERIKELEDMMDALDVRGCYRDWKRIDGLFGRAHLFHEFGGNDGSTDKGSQDLRTDVGNGVGDMSASKVGTKNPLTAIRVIEPVWTYPTTYNAINPLRRDWYNPQVWYTMGQQIHASRIFTLVGEKVPDMLKPAYSFGGLSLTQLGQAYVNRWLQVADSVARTVHAYSVNVLKTDLQTTVQEGGGELLRRVALFNMMRDNNQTFVLNNATEDFANVSTPLSGLHELQAQSQEHMCSVWQIPVAIYTGISPTGLNASSEGEIRIFENTIASKQESSWRNPLKRTIHFCMLSLWDEIDTDIVFDFVPLREMTEKENAEIQKLKAETDDLLVNGVNAIDNGEVRSRIANDPDSGYDNINPDDIPEPPPMPDGAEGGEGGPGGGGKVDLKGNAAFGGKSGGGQDAVVPFDAGDEWNESDHPRDHGKFSSVAGSGAAHTKKHGIEMSELTKSGPQLGSNEGGKYTDAQGKELYVKKLKSPEHVTSEVLASKLFALAGGKTLDYKRIAGGQHLATKWEKADKNNLDQFSSTERKAAQNDFALHAWIANWDAAGLGNDNYSSKGGKVFPNDLGGSLEWRAQGAPKGKAFGNSAGEWDTMRDPSMSAQNAALFGDMTPEQLRQSALRVALVPDDAIRKAVKGMGKPDAMADQLIARKRDIEQRANGDPKDAGNAVTFDRGGKLPVKELNGIPFKKWSPPADWSKVEGTIGNLDGDDEMVVPDKKRASSGIMMVEPDGRVWLMRPTNGFGGYQQTLPKGGIEEGLTPQQNAIKEVWEETGIKARITNIIGDIEGDSTMTRYYYGERESGDPTDHEWEASAVVLAPADRLEDYLNRSRDRTITKHVLGADEMVWGLDDASWEEGKHPRDETGQFAAKGSGSFGKKAESAPATTEHKTKGSLIKALLGGGTSPEETLKALEKHFPDSGYKLKDVKWYQNKMGKAGQIKAKAAEPEPMPSPEPAKAPPEPEPPKPAPEPLPKPKAPQASPGDLEKAKKTTPFYAPNGIPPGAEKLVEAYNTAYAGKEITDPDALNQKVVDYKGTKLLVDHFAAEHAAKTQAEQQAAAAKAAEANKAIAAAQAKAQAEKNAAAKVALDKQKAAEHAQIAEVTKALGVSENEAVGFNALLSMIGGSKQDLLSQFQGHAKEAAGHGYKVSGFEYALIQSYINGAYMGVNAALREGSLSMGQHVYAKLLNAALDKLPKYTGTVTRGTSLSADQIASYKPGHVIEERGFTSSGVNFKFGGSVHYTIKANGKRSADFSTGANQDEKEVLFKAHTFFLVHSVKTQGGVTHIEMEEVDGHE